jgi:DNA-binding response OmpR family regulator
LTKNARILVVDDDDCIRESLAMGLEIEGFSVDTAKSGKEAIEKSYANLYNLAIIDWRLPDIEGTELLGKLRETKPKMVKILLTGYPSMQNAITALNEGANAFFLKPVEFELLTEKINRCLREQEEIQSLIDYARIALKLSQKNNIEEQQDETGPIQ